MNILTDCVRVDREYGQLLNAVLSAKKSARSALPFLVTGLCEGATDSMFVSLIEDLKKHDKRPILMIFSEEKECVRVKNLFEQFGIRTAFYVGRDLTFYNITASHEYEHERLRVLSGILDGSYDVVVTTPDAALGYTVPPEKLIGATLKIEYGETNIEPSVLAQKLVDAGYVRTELVDAPGQFALRGGIFDIYPSNARFLDVDKNEMACSQPFRIELFGDEIDRMEMFDPETQRMTLTLERVDFFPAREILADEKVKQDLKKVIQAWFAKSHDERACTEMISEIAAIDGGTEINFIDKYITLVYPERACLLDYFGKKSTVFVKNTLAVYERIKASEWHLNQNIEELIEGGTIAPKYTDYSKPASQLDLFLEDNIHVHFDSLGQGMSGKKLGAMFTFRTKHMVSYCENLELLCEDLDGYKKGGYKIVLIAENEAAAKNLSNLLVDRGISAVVETANGDYTIDTLPKNVVYIKWREYIRGYEMNTP